MAHSHTRFGPPLALACLLALGGLSACNQQPTGQSATELAANSTAPLPPLPMATGPATAPAYAPPAAALPAAGSLRVGRLERPDDSYAYVDRADGFSDALGDAPPDYSFAYDRVSPWAWEAADSSMEFAEPVSGGYRYYYYEPGADTPYLVRDPYNSYAYSGGELVMVYDAYGRALGDRATYGRADYGARYFARGEALRRAAFQNERRGVIAANWAARRSQIDASRTQWTQARARDAGWRAYHDAHAAAQQAHWQAERVQRQRETAQFADWHRNDFRGPPPGKAAPVPQSGWQRVRSMFSGASRQAAAQQQSRLAAQQAPLQRRRPPEQPQAAIPKQRPAFAAPQQNAAKMRGTARTGQQAQQTAERDRSTVQQRAARQQVEIEHMQLQARRTAQANAGRRAQEQAQRQQARIQRRQEPGMAQQRPQTVRLQLEAPRSAQADNAHRQFIQPQRQRAPTPDRQVAVAQHQDHGRPSEGARHQAAPQRQPERISRPPMPAHPKPSQPASHKGGSQGHKNHGQG